MLRLIVVLFRFISLVSGHGVIFNEPLEVVIKHEPLCLVHLIGDFIGPHELRLVDNAGLAVRLEHTERLLLIVPDMQRGVEPQLVPDETAAEVRAAVIAADKVIGFVDALRLERRINIRPLEPVVCLLPGHRAVEVVAAGLHDQVQIDAAIRRFHVVRDGLHSRFLERGIVEIRAAATGLPRIGRHDAVEDQPGRRLGGYSVHAHRRQ